MLRTETDKPIHILHDVYLVEVQGTQILPPPQLLGYLYESEDSTSVLLT